ncbi:MAG: hypothetical protein DHS20C13_24220 [Thermodesulfobacteriota bacterium]|nr:MAG: hypothetical protein DHS20C13_24220 [Thermodesulfobacteriota bacterium]
MDRVFDTMLHCIDQNLIFLTQDHIQRSDLVLVWLSMSLDLNSLNQYAKYLYNKMPNQLVYGDGHLSFQYRNNFLQSGIYQDGVLDDEKNLYDVQCEHHTKHEPRYVEQMVKKLEAEALKPKRL